MSIVTEWVIRTRAVMARSQELKTLDTAVNDWATKGQGIQDVNMRNTWTAFEAWKAAHMDEYNRISDPADDLQDELAAQWRARPAQLARVRPTAVKPAGWKLINYNPARDGGTLLPAGQHVPPMTAAQIGKINESMMRVKTAIEVARDAMIVINKRKAFTAPMQIEEQTYVDFFGQYDATRFSKVLVNFRTLALAFENTPEITDVRNRTQWATTYGGCVRRNLGATVKGVLGLTGTVNMLVGRSFLGSGSYEKTTDDTIATLVHEFAHGALDAVDAPDVDANGTLKCTVTSTDPTNRDFGLSTNPHNCQCSTEDHDKILAKHHPQYAVVNADSYGQFTKQLLLAKRA